MNQTENIHPLPLNLGWRCKRLSKIRFMFVACTRQWFRIRLDIFFANIVTSKDNEIAMTGVQPMADRIRTITFDARLLVLSELIAVCLLWPSLILSSFGQTLPSIQSSNLETPDHVGRRLRWSPPTIHLCLVLKSATVLFILHFLKGSTFVDQTSLNPIIVEYSWNYRYETFKTPCQ